MAKFSTITVQELTDVNKFKTEASFSGITTALASNGASAATYGACFEMKERDDKYLVLVQNVCATSDAADKTVTIKAGNGIQGVADVAKTDLGNGEYTIIAIESGRFKNVKENETLKALSSATASDQISAKGKVFITGSSADIKVAVFRLP